MREELCPCVCRPARAEQKGKDWPKGYLPQLLPCQPQDSKETEGAFLACVPDMSVSVRVLHC